MATIPNAYYNSPWIRDAAQNLASALAPQDPAKTLEMQREKWKFERLQEIARLEDEDRQKGIQGDEAIAALMADADAKPITAPGPWQAGYVTPGAPVTPHMDDATYRKNVGTALAGHRSLADVAIASGRRGGDYARQSGLLEIKGENSLDLQGSRNAGALDRSQYTSEAAWARALMKDKEFYDALDANTKLKLKLAAIEGEQKKEHDAATVTNKPPSRISAADDRASRESIIDWADTLVPKDQTYTGESFNLPPDVLNAVVDYTNELFRLSNDYPAAKAEALRFYFGPNPKFLPAQDPAGWGDEDDYPDSIPLRDGKSLPELQAELAQNRAAVAASAPTVPGQPPPMIAAPGANQDTRAPVTVFSLDQARALPGNTRFIVMPEGRLGTTPPKPMQ